MLIAPLSDVHVRPRGRLSTVDNVEAVPCGYVQRPMVRRWAGTLACACPNTTTGIALQFAPDAVPRSHLGPPSCMLHLWQPGQGLVSHTSHIGWPVPVLLMSGQAGESGGGESGSDPDY